MAQKDESKETFGKRVERLRTDAGMSRMELAFRVGVHLNTLAGWEKDQGKPSFEHLRRLRELLPALL